MTLLVKKISTSDEKKICLDIRYQVFVKGQNVPLEEEVDGKDDESEHYLLFVNKQPVGTARVRYLDSTAKIERVAILDAFQGKGYGKQLMQAILRDLQNTPGITKAKLGAQSYAISFYEKLGFSICSDEYLDAGIPHKDMQKIWKTEQKAIASWKPYAAVSLETIICFCISALCLGIYLTHFDGNWAGAVMMVIIFIFINMLCVKRIIDRFSLAAIMLLIPIAPLAVLIVFLLLIPVLQWLK